MFKLVVKSGTALAMIPIAFIVKYYWNSSGSILSNSNSNNSGYCIRSSHFSVVIFV